MTVNKMVDHQYKIVDEDGWWSSWNIPMIINMYNPIMVMVISLKW